MTEKKKPVRISTEERSLPVKLTQDETLEYGRKLADSHQAMTELELEDTAFKQQIKSRMAVIEGEIGAKSSALRQGYEHRKVRCEILHDYGRGLVIVRRTDTNAEVESRKMSESERQTEFEGITDGIAK